MKKFNIFFSAIFLVHILNTAFAVKPTLEKWNYIHEDFQFTWDFASDHASMVKISGQQNIWQGSLLPAFWLKNSNGEKLYVKAEVDLTNIKTKDEATILELNFSDLASGTMVIKKQDWGISIEKLSLEWIDQIPEILSMYFGVSVVPKEGQPFLAADDLPFRANWSSAGFCVPGAKEGPAQSYFRMWDFGQTTIALGNYGPSLGTLYGAAFPRPVLAFGMGNNNGWVSFGAGSIPNAAMLLKLQNSHGCIKYLYREDLWGVGEKKRVWDNPLRITFANNSWSAFRGYFQSLPKKAPISEIHSKSIWNTWGNWKNQEYPIRSMVDFAKIVGAETFVVDDPWEKSQGLGKPSFERFPEFFEDFEYLENHKIQRGIWETLGWITDTLEAGLTSDDLIVNKNGVPCKSSWNFDAFGSGFYSIDISSERSRIFLQERTKWTMEHIKPKLIKLDFGYGLPSPNMGVPRNPEIRGERYCYELFKLIVESAKSVNPDVTIMYYGINPLYLSLVDMVSLDDQGDLWHEVKEGHDQWSIWASLLSDQQLVLSGSSGYDWHNDDEVVLNSFILGIPGAVLATHLDDGSPVPEKYLNRRLAINTWFRKTIQWEPTWLNSHVGNLSRPPQIKCWGRKEMVDGKAILAALILSGAKDEKIETLNSFEWQGRWALISQTNEDILQTSKLAIVPFDVGFVSIKLPEKPTSVEKMGIDGTKICSGWKWQDGKIIIQIDENQLNQTAGFIIKTNN